MSQTRLRVLATLLAVAGASSVFFFAGIELLGRGYPGLGKIQMGGILGGLGMIGIGHAVALRGAGLARARSLPWLLGLGSVLFASGVMWWIEQPVPPEPDTALYERLLAAERSLRPARRELGQCLPPAAGRPIVPLALDSVIGGLSKPVYAAAPGDGSRRLFVVEKGGSIRIVKDGRLLEEPFLDIRARVVSDDRPPASWEQGLLSVAFPPDFASSDRFYVHYTAVPDGNVTVSRFLVGEGPDRADPRSEQVILTVPTAGPNHNGGQLQFGPDGYLYVGLGDGEGWRWPDSDRAVYGDGAVERDESESFEAIIPTGSDYTYADIITDDPWNQAQDLGSLLGKILRLDVGVDSTYAVPGDNPFAVDGDDSTRGEIWAYGLRNPWRFSIDSCDGALFAGDVGRSHFEEINLVKPGGNYGWKVMEGAHCFPRWPHTYTCDTRGLEFPIAEYGHIDIDPSGGNAVIGGYVYRGRRIPSLVGRYVFADFISGRLWALTPTGLTASGWDRQELMTVGFLPTSLGVDVDGELLVIGYAGTIYRLVPDSAGGPDR